jgi:poly(ADP-ribose) glycohydrolase
MDSGKQMEMYLLPCSSQVLRGDRFDILGSDELELHFWQILEAIISVKATCCSELVDQLQTIALTLHGTLEGREYGYSEQFISRELPGCFRTIEGAVELDERHFFSAVWPKLVDLALEMPSLFVEGYLHVLTPEHPQVVMSRSQVACLVVHQFLGSLLRQPWETDSYTDFSVWCGSGSGHSGAIHTYLSALFVYFERITHNEAFSDATSNYPIIFTLRPATDYFPEDAPLSPMTVTHEPSPTTAPRFLGIPDGACVISANKNIGFGKSATQEEMHVGCSPECCPAVLITPTLGDREVLIVQGPQAMVSIKGYGREAQLDELLANKLNSDIWERRTMLFMDALELDLYDSRDKLPDLLPGNVDRELRKAYTAFSSGNTAYSHIVTGLWGSGAFGGNREIKSLIQWCAASMAGVSLHFVCAGPDQLEFSMRLAELVKHSCEHSWRMRSILDLLRSLRPDEERSRRIFAYLVESLDKST